MSLRIVAVGMLDARRSGRDTFFVQIDDEHAMLYEARTDGTVDLLSSAPEPLAMVSASVEKFNSAYRVVEPVPIDDPGALPGYLGRFQIVDATRCRLRD
jgi:hypothetical protein